MYINVNKEILLLLAHARSVLLESITSSPEARTKKKKLQDTILNKLTDYQILEMVVGGRVVTSKKSDIARELVLHEAFTRIVSGSLLEMGSDKELCEAIRNSLPLRFYKMSSRFNEAKEYLKGEKKIPYVSLQEAPKIKAKIKQKLVKALISESRSVLDPQKERELLAKAKMLLESDLNYDDLSSIATNQMVDDIQGWAVMPIKMSIGFFLGWQLGRYLRRLHEKHLSKAARECRGRKGTDLDACIKKYKIQSLQAQIRQVQSSARLCSKTTDPQKCNQEIQKKLAKLRAKLQKNISESVREKPLVKESSYLQKNVALNEYDFLIPPDYTAYPELYGNPFRNYHIQYGSDLIIPPMRENPSSVYVPPDLPELQSNSTEILNKLPSDLAKVSTNQMVKDIEQSSLMPIRIAVWFFVGWHLGRLLRQLHERYLSKAARECRGRKGTELDTCIKKYKIQSLQAQIRQVQSSARLCSKTTDPQKCNQEIRKKLAKLRAKLQKNISESVRKKPLVKESSYLTEWDAQSLLDFLKDLVEKAGGDVAAAISWLGSPSGFLPYIPLSVFLAFMAWAIVQEKRTARNKAMPKCRGLFGEALKNCVRKYEIKDLQRQIRNVERSKQRVCPKTDNPPKCYREMDKRIQKLKEKLNKKLAEDREFSNKFVRR
jgi:G:T/U-mismatch repair DNA glycosylase